MSTFYRVPPLAVPAEDTQALEDVLRHGAVKLFVARAREADPHFSPDQQTAAAIAAICRRLDGIPLALELAAARASTLGMQELASRLDDCFSLLTEGRRTALRRHQTLRAMLDWSYELLPESERMVLRHLSIFAGGFSLAAASAVIGSANLLASDVVDNVANLVAKSLVTADVYGAAVHYRLLETTRAYAREKLAGHGELEQAGWRHAQYYRALCGQAEAEWETRPAADWLAGGLRAADPRPAYGPAVREARPPRVLAILALIVAAAGPVAAGGSWVWTGVRPLGGRIESAIVSLLQPLTAEPATSLAVQKPHLRRKKTDATS